MHERQTNRLLGYPDDARLLIVNADDFGMYHAINRGCAAIHTRRRRALDQSDDALSRRGCRR